MSEYVFQIVFKTACLQTGKNYEKKILVSIINTLNLMFHSAEFLKLVNLTNFHIKLIIRSSSNSLLTDVMIALLIFVYRFISNIVFVCHFTSYQGIYAGDWTICSCLFARRQIAYPLEFRFVNENKKSSFSPSARLDRVLRIVKLLTINRQQREQSE